MQSKTRKGNGVIRSIVIILAVAIYLIGAYAIIYPYAKVEIKGKEAAYAAESFLQDVTMEHTEYQKGIQAAQLAGSIGASIDAAALQALNLDIPYADLLTAMIEYNQDIYQNGQADFKDAWSYTAQKFDLQAYGVQDEIVGTIEIPALESVFPIYLGATPEHMASGMAQLTETSMPIGGKNTNCVLAGHRGWSNGKFLKDIEKVQLGDIITVTNLWYEMKYKVAEIKIIEPNDIKEVLIQDGRDLLTISTCHPYGSGGRYRYLVICERVDDTAPVEIEIDTNTAETREPQLNMAEQKKEVIFFSSEREILFDDILHYIGIALVVLLPILVTVVLLHRRRKNKNF